ncbi:uncharacterized protein TEOVI_000580900 [Trypanosoma equiperdum]|uniref:Uncharacterized protein n=2 Tax=Trypanozoon TaxID=39700 RepID=Q57VE5_TRYB2|nr:hypothetical protein, conserved [Trypanosoma brucei brucei TREU927]AAX70470.1 hypothetical protein, conserved [Trypanosoma brucei]AAZ11233.1 hypothetical protein, conserved [Trypanosoma brucei brucei TREU927]SCU66095.1 hypothetical protein, conserved [Trypanosoma equiperdum]
MQWPSWVLSEENRALQRRAQRAATDLSEKMDEAAAHREVVELMLRNIGQLRRAVDSAALALTEQKKLEESDEAELQQVRQDGSYFRTELQTLHRRQDQLQELLLRSEAALKSKTLALERQQQELASVLHEQEELLQQRENEGIDGGEFQKHLSVFEAQNRQRFDQLQGALQREQTTFNAAKDQLDREREEYKRVQRELAAMRASIEREKREKLKSSLTIQQVHELMKSTEARTLENAALYATGKESMESQRTMLMKLQCEAEELERQRKLVDKHLQDRLREQDRLTALLSSTTAEVENQQKEMASMRRQLSAQRDVNRELALSRDNAIMLRDERWNRQAQLIHHAQELKVVRDEIQRQQKEGTNVPGPRYLLQTLDALKANERQLDGQMERLRAANVACVSQLMQHARQGESLDGRMAAVRKSLAAADRDHAQQCQLREQCERQAEALTSKVEEQQQRLQAARLEAAARSGAQYAMLLGNAQDLRVRLQGEQRRGYELRRLVAPLQYTLNSRRRALLEDEEKLAHLVGEAGLRGAELQRLESEKAQSQQEKQTALLLVEEANLQLQTLNRLAESRMVASCEAAGMQEIMRGQALAAEEAHQDDAKNALLLLHLEQRAVSDKHAELRRRQQQLQALKDRYQDIMRSMARNAALAANVNVRAGQNSDPSSVTSSSPWEYMVEKDESLLADTSVDPEVLHAKFILHASTTREKLWEKGNQLDARVMFLEHEVSALRKMLHAMRSTGSHRERTIEATSSNLPKRSERQNPNDTQLLTSLREGLTRGQQAVEVELQGVKESLQLLQKRMQEVGEKHRSEMRRLSELRSLKVGKEAQLRRLRDKLQRQQTQKVQQRLKPLSALCGRSA